MKAVFFQAALGTVLVFGAQGCSRYSSVSKIDPAPPSLPVLRSSGVEAQRKAVPEDHTIWGFWASPEESAFPTSLDLREGHGIKFKPRFLLDRVQASSGANCRIQASTEDFEILEIPDTGVFEIRVNDPVFTALAPANDQPVDGACTEIAERRTESMKNAVSPWTLQMSPVKDSDQWILEIPSEDGSPPEMIPLHFVSLPPPRR